MEIEKLMALRNKNEKVTSEYKLVRCLIRSLGYVVNNYRIQLLLNCFKFL